MDAIAEADAHRRANPSRWSADGVELAPAPDVVQEGPTARQDADPVA